MSAERTPSWARKFFCIEKRNIIDKVTKVNVEIEFDRCIETDNNGKECGATFKHCVKNGTSALINHLRKVHGDNLQVKATVKGRSASWARNFFCIEKRNILDKLTKVRVAREFDRCIVTDDNGKECGATFKHCIKNGTSALNKHLRKVHSDNFQVKAALKDISEKVGVSQVSKKLFLIEFKIELNFFLVLYFR